MATKCKTSGTIALDVPDPATHQVSRDLVIASLQRFVASLCRAVGWYMRGMLSCAARSGGVSLVKRGCCYAEPEVAPATAVQGGAGMQMNELKPGQTIVTERAWDDPLKKMSPIPPLLQNPVRSL